MIPATERSIATPAGFHFPTTVRSHGWCLLAPVAWDDEAVRLERPLVVPGGVTRVAFEQPGGSGGPLQVSIVGGRGKRSGLDAAGWRAVERATTRMFQLDRDFADFERLARRAGESFGEAVARGFGRLLRSPTLFEDVVKILATTNTTWGGTVAMVRNLVGMTTGDAFPTPGQVAAVGARRLASEGRWGYRAAYLAGFAEAVSEGEPDLDRWERWDGTTEELAAEVRRVPGLGPYATAHVLMLLGRFDRIGIDTAFRGFVRQKYFPRARKPVTDVRMLAVYEKWGEWRGLAYWADLWLWHMERT
ncbi:MAG: DNA-3-methyladenine glycosylase family protein [Gemmatimonadota bacterium]